MSLNIPLSVLDLAMYPEGKSIADAFQSSRDLAQHAEKWGYSRYWLAEHHNLEGIASSATAVLIGYVAGHTQTIRVGSGGIMLPNHAPLMIAEQFGTLATLYPNRIDLGLGRAPGSDQATMRAIRKEAAALPFDFAEQIEELEYYLAPAKPEQKVRAIPGAGIDIPL
ncbi:MAG TPA: MsnO8 family LLM class oxidoreductase [Oligoflexus sp.]|nr:MsnO8 family LLM class oxidoreductase [Oligoflexus sp.]HYX34409.1 MsnO8 family LLM class oxidoreductase [Oligoflexus sp.]